MDSSEPFSLEDVFSNKVRFGSFVEDTTGGVHFSALRRTEIEVFIVPVVEQQDLSGFLEQKYWLVCSFTILRNMFKAVLVLRRI